MKTFRSIVAILVFIICIAPVVAQQKRVPKRVALLIGNTNYKNSPLKNPKNDVVALGKALRSVGFQVTERFDQTKFETEEDIDKITAGLKKGDAVLIFFSGHGLEIKNTNFLQPIGVKEITRPFHIGQRFIDADYILAAIEESGASLRIMILDACRSNPLRSFSKNVGRGLAPVEAPDGTIIAYSTAPGETASDGRDNTSPFVKQLVKTLGTHPPQGLEINNMFMTVARAMRKETGQRAYVNNDASMDQFFLKPMILPDKPIGSEKLEPSDNYRVLDIATVTKHAEYGFAEAQAQLGYMYSQGIQVAQDQVAAVQWTRRAVDKGSPRAMNNLGVYYEKGRGVEKDKETALKYYRLSAENGYSLAKRNLGMMYMKGDGVEQDGQLAIDWVTEAALSPPDHAGDITMRIAERDLGNMYHYGQAGVKVDYQKALDWYRKSAKRGYADAQVELGMMNEYGRGVEENLKEAVKFYSTAAEQANKEGLFRLGNMYQNAKGVNRDYKMAIGLYKRAAELEHSKALFRLGYMFNNGLGVAENKKEAIQWYLKAQKKGIPQAYYNVALMYHNGDGVKQNYNEANRLYQIAAKEGHLDSQWNLAHNYEKGRGFKKDRKKALHWYRKAAAQGDKEAKRKVRELEE